MVYQICGKQMFSLFLSMCCVRVFITEKKNSISPSFSVHSIDSNNTNTYSDRRIVAQAINNKNCKSYSYSMLVHTFTFIRIHEVFTSVQMDQKSFCFFQNYKFIIIQILHREYNSTASFICRSTDERFQLKFYKIVFPSENCIYNFKIS